MEEPDGDTAETEHPSLDRLIEFATSQGDMSGLLDDARLASLGMRVVEEWDRDRESNADWRTKVEEALDRAAQEDPEDAKEFPWSGASQVDYPILTVASQQFAARTYPAIVRGDEAAGVKVLGKTSEAKQARAQRVKTYLNYMLFYRMEGWEDETDLLLNQLPVVGTVFKKIYRGDGGTCSDFVNPLRLTVSNDTKTLRRCPRITHDFDLYPYEIDQKIRAGTFRDVELAETDDDKQKPRLTLEQHRLEDLDDDGIDEPYIVTVDHETQKVLRIEAGYGPDDVIMGDGNKVASFKRWVPFVKFPFLRDPKGRFYEPGFGHLLGPLNDAINALLNQLIDAGTAANAGGGFIAGGLRLQNAGQGSTIKMKPGEFKTVNTPAGQLQGSIWERTVPGASPTSFQMLEMLLGAAKDITGVTDVITGDAPTTAPVGTTMALIDQGQQVFKAIFKRIFRAQREEYKLIYECEGRWGGEQAKRKYAELLDDPQADFAKDFSGDGEDIVPVADPNVVTKAEGLAQAGFLQQFLGQPWANSQGIYKRILDAGGIADPEQLIAQPGAPDPMLVAEVHDKKTKGDLQVAQTIKTLAEAGSITGETHGAGGVGSLEGAPGDGMGVPGMPEGSAGPEDGMGPPELGGQQPGPTDPDGTSDPGGQLPSPGGDQLPSLEDA